MSQLSHDPLLVTYSFGMGSWDHGKNKFCKSKVDLKVEMLFMLGRGA
jgi:hypothetical protein